MVGRLVDLLEPAWRRHLSSGRLAGELDVEAGMLAAVARELGTAARSETPAAAARRWPACVVVALAQVAGHRDTTRKVWPAWHRAAGTRNSRHSAAAWGEAFAASLASLGLPAPHDDATQAVLAHAAVPTSVLPAFLRLVRAGAAERELAELDPAVAALLRMPAGAAFVNRCRTLLTAPAEEAEEAEPDLPERVVEVAREVTAAAPLGSGRALRLEPYGLGVLTGDGLTPVRPDEVTDHFLVFDDAGEPLSTSLPPEPVWVVYRDGSVLRADTKPRVQVESRLPLTWAGWRLAQVDLSTVSWLELEPGGDRRMVRGRTGPRLVTGAVVPGAQALDGSPVYGTLPEVRLPAGSGRWRVEVRRSASGPVLARAQDPARLWDRVARPVLGELVVTAAPLDAPHLPGLRRVLTVVEGLRTAFSPTLRLPAERGQEPVEAVLSGVTVAPSGALIEPETAAIEVTCVSGPVVLPLRIVPPHSRVRIDPEPGSGGTATAWHSLGPLPLETADLARGGALRLDLPSAAGLPVLDVVVSGQTVQVLEPSRLGRYPLRRMLDTVRLHGGAELTITVGGRTATVARVSATPSQDDPWLSG